MTPKIAFWTALAVIAAVLTDALVYDYVGMVYLAHRLFDLIDWLSIWRRPR